MVLLPYPVNLIQIVYMQVLSSNTSAVNILQPVDDFSQGERFLFAPNKGCLGQLEHSIQVL